MTPMHSIDLEQRSAAWRHWRAQGISASDIPVILGLSPYKTRWQLWAEKTGRLSAPDISHNPHVKRGIALEDQARQLAEQRYGDMLLPVCGEYAQWRILRASFDGLDKHSQPYEFKAPGETVWQELEKQGRAAGTYKLYEAQVHAQCLVAGASTGRLIFYTADGQDLDFQVQLSTQKKQHILEAAKCFWHHIKTQTPPALDPARDGYFPESAAQRAQWQINADVWRGQYLEIQKLKDQLKALEKVQTWTQQALIKQMGAFMQADIGGVKVARFTKKGNVDYAAYLKATFGNQDLSKTLEGYRKASREEARFSLSSDDAVIQSFDTSAGKTV